MSDLIVTTAALTVVDLRHLPDYPSLFDPERLHLREPIEFLCGFVKDATEVADPSAVIPDTRDAACPARSREWGKVSRPRPGHM